MATSTEPIIVQIICEGAGVAKNIAGGGGKSGGGKSVGGMAASAMGSLGKLGGMVAAVTEIAGMINEAVSGVLKPVKTLLIGIMKLIVQFARPIMDIVIILLQPLLMMLKPLVKMFNQLMQPFRKIAYDLMREANTKVSGSTAQGALIGGAVGILLGGVISSLIAIALDQLKRNIRMVIGLFNNIILFPIIDIVSSAIALIPAVSDEGVAKVFVSLKAKIDSGIDDATTSIQEKLGGLQKQFVSDSLAYADQISTELTTQFKDIDVKPAANVVQTKIEDMMLLAANNAKVPGKGGVSSPGYLTVNSPLGGAPLVNIPLQSSRDDIYNKASFLSTINNIVGGTTSSRMTSSQKNNVSNPFE